MNKRVSVVYELYVVHVYVTVNYFMISFHSVNINVLYIFYIQSIPFQYPIRPALRVEGGQMEPIHFYI